MPQKSKYSAPVSIRMNKAVLKELDKVAKRYCVPRSRLILDVIEDFLINPPAKRPTRTTLTENTNDTGIFD